MQSLTPALLTLVLVLACKPASDQRDSTRTRIGTAATAEDARMASSATQFVRRFYAEYLPLARGNGSALDTVLAKHPEYFAPELLAALQNDAKARDAAQGVIDGLDFDPFVNSQDPCERYVVGDVWSLAPNAPEPRLGIAVDAECARKRQRAVVVDLVRRDSSWAIADMEYVPTPRHLLGVLRELHPR